MAVTGSKRGLEEASHAHPGVATYALVFEISSGSSKDLILKSFQHNSRFPNYCYAYDQTPERAGP
jgi:hypothetical protein